MTATSAAPAASATARLHGRALITGGTSGIGLAFADALAARGSDIVLVARNRERLRDTAARLSAAYGVEVETIVADLATVDGVRAAVERLTADTESVEILINNAGHGLHVSLLSSDSGPIESAHALMIGAVHTLAAAAGRSMKGRGHGVIVNVASIAGMIPMGAYSAIKAWVTTYSESLALELADSGVQVTTLLPGWVHTEFHDRAGIRTGSVPAALWLDADRVVAECLRDVERGRLRSLPSRRYALLAFLAQHAPRPLVRRVTTAILGGRK